MKKINGEDFNILTSLLTRPLLVTYGKDISKQDQTIKKFIKNISTTNTNNLQEFLYNPKSNNNDSDLTSDDGNGFLNHLDKADANPNNIYIYLLRNIDEKGSSDYLYNYLDALYKNNQLSIGESNINTDKNTVVKKNNKLLKVDINTKEKLSSKYDFSDGSVNIQGFNVTSEINFTDFHKEIFKTIIEKYLNNNNNKEKLLQETSITTIENLKKRGFIIHNEDKLEFKTEGGFKFYMKKEGWKTKTNYFYYKGYVIQTMLSYDSRLSRIKTLLKFLGKKETSSFYINFHTINKSKEKYKESKIETTKENDEYSDLGGYRKIPNNFFVVCSTKKLKNIDLKIREASSILEIEEDTIFKNIENNNSKIDILELLDIEIKNIVNLLNFKEVIDIKKNISKYCESATEELKGLQDKYKDLPNKIVEDSLIFINMGKEILKNYKIEQLEEQLQYLAFKQIIIPTLFSELKILNTKSDFIVKHPLLEKYKNEFTFEKEGNQSNNNNDIIESNSQFSNYNKNIVIGGEINYDKKKNIISYEGVPIILSKKNKSDSVLIILLDNFGKEIKLTYIAENINYLYDEDITKKEKNDLYKLIKDLIYNISIKNKTDTHPGGKCLYLNKYIEINTYTAVIKKII